MKVILINGSAKKNGCTAAALEEVAGSLTVEYRKKYSQVA